MLWTVPKMWLGADVFILGGGASLPRQFGVPEKIINQVLQGQLPPSAYSPYMKILHNKQVIAINAAYRIGDWIDMVFFGDQHFFLENMEGLAAFGGLKVSCSSSVKRHPWVKHLQMDRTRPRGISSNPRAVSWNANSGAAAISVAVHAGAKRIFLLGFDMKLGIGDRQHWHTLYRKDRNAPVDQKHLPFAKHLQYFPAIAADAKRVGVEIINLCPDSAITVFPRQSLDSVLSSLSQNENSKELPPEKEPVKWGAGIERRVFPKHDNKILCFVNHYYNPDQKDGFKGGATLAGNLSREGIVKKAIDQLKTLPNCEVKICGLEGYTVDGIEVDIDFTGIQSYHLPYESLNYMNDFVNDYDYFINIEDDILLKENVIQDIIEFDRTHNIDEVFLPNRIEVTENGIQFIDLKRGWKKDSESIVFKDKVLRIANNYHSAVLILSTEKFRYGYSKLDSNFREVWWGGPMASAYAYFHTPFKLYRNSDFTNYHCVEHLDHWKSYESNNRFSTGKQRELRVKAVLDKVKNPRNLQMFEVKVPYALNMKLDEAYNEAMESSNCEWVLLLDHDVFVSCNPHWHSMCMEVINKVNDQVGLITCVSNPRNRQNKGSQWADIIELSSNLDNHVIAAKKLYEKYGTYLRKIPTFKVAGFFMLVRKSVWKDIHFRNVGKGVDLIDWDFCKRLMEAGHTIYEMPGLYTYHRRNVRKMDWGISPELPSENASLPKTFSEQIRHYMKHPYVDYDYGLYIDKYKVKEFVSPIVNVAKVLGYFTTQKQIDSFDYDSLPHSFVIKATHGSHMNIIVRNGVELQSANHKTKEPFNLIRSKGKMKEWLNTIFSEGGETYYDQVKRGVLIEENLCEYFTDYEKENGIIDYKAWCIHGKIEFIATANFNGTEVNYYDTEWNELPFKRDDKCQIVPFPKPDNLSQMIETIHKLSDKVNNPQFVRVDLYSFGREIFFGEYTHSPGKGEKVFLPRAEKAPRNKYELNFGKAMLNNRLTIVCFKWKYKYGVKLPAVERIGDYTAEYVNKLYRAVKRNLTLPHRFVCITDDPVGVECETFPLWDWNIELGRCFPRLKMYDSAMRLHFGNRIAIMDLDTVVTGNLDAIFSRKEDFIIHTYYPDSHGYRQRYNGSLTMMNTGCRSQVFDQFKGIPSAELLSNLVKEKRYIGSDQAWINYMLGDDESRFDEQDGIYHLKRIMVPPPGSKRGKGELPENAKMVMFSGNQDPSMGMYENFNWVKNNWI